jgi:hypothetical protein
VPSVMRLWDAPEHQPCRGAVGNAKPPRVDMAQEQEWHRAKTRYERRDECREKYRANGGAHRRSPVANVSAYLIRERTHGRPG